MKKISPNFLFNNIGQITEGIPFSLFGPIPYKGSYIVIGIEDLLNSEINMLLLEIHWLELPKNLKKHYEGYEKIYSFTNNCHQVAISVYLNGYYYSLGAFCLFNEDRPNEHNSFLLPISQFNLNIKDALSPIQCLQLNENKVNSDGFKCGIKIELISPTVAFGHSQFSNLYSEIAIQNSRLFRKKNSLPNQPFSPVAEKILMYYN